MVADYVVFPGMLLSDQVGESFYRVGAIIFDRTGARYGLTARHILEKQRSSAVLDGITGRIVGERVSDDLEWPRKGPFFRAIGRFRISPAAPVKMATPFRSIVGVADPRELVGSPVFWLEDSYSKAPAEVVAVGGAISFKRRLRDGSEMPVTMTEVIEVRTNSAPAPSPGELGTLIVDADDRALGLLIFRQSDVALVAPLLPYLEAFNATMADDRPSVVAGVDQNLEVMRTELQQLTIGMSRMRHELEEQARTPGLADEEAPVELAALLETTT